MPVCDFVFSGFKSLGVREKTEKAETWARSSPPCNIFGGFGVCARRTSFRHPDIWMLQTRLRFFRDQDAKELWVRAGSVYHHLVYRNT